MDIIYIWLDTHRVYIRKAGKSKNCNCWDICCSSRYNHCTHTTDQYLQLAKHFTKFDSWLINSNLFEVIFQIHIIFLDNDHWRSLCVSQVWFSDSVACECNAVWQMTFKCGMSSVSQQHLNAPQAHYRGLFYKCIFFHVVCLKSTVCFTVSPAITDLYFFSFPFCCLVTTVLCNFCMSPLGM